MQTRPDQHPPYIAINMTAGEFAAVITAAAGPQDHSSASTSTNALNSISVSARDTLTDAEMRMSATGNLLSVSIPHGDHGDSVSSIADSLSALATALRKVQQEALDLSASQLLSAHARTEGSRHE